MNNGESKYVLRRAAGLYWLIDTGQAGVPYKKPLPMNEAGARIFVLREKGMEYEEIADSISLEYNVDKEAVLKDITEFERQLREYEIRF